ncbi:MAG: ATP-binding protein [Nanoarchaeota archaeon]|nr:ATP-binding protein [Nanoarchaeota archaeon]
MNNIEDVFEEWNSYAGNKELIERNIDLENIKSNSKLKIISISGVRRSGKTSILLILHNLLKKQNEKVGYINLEDSRIKSDKEVLDKIIKWFGDSGYLLLDEITSVSDWESWLSRNHEMLKGKLKIIVSSSRSNLIFPTKSLRGRILSNELYPLSFKEFLDFKKFKIEKTTAGIGKIERLLSEYLTYGGFPETVLIENNLEKIRLIDSYFKDIISLDVAEIAKENLSTVELFGKYIIESSYFSASKCLNFFKSAGYKIAKQTLLNIEKSSEEGYLFFFIPIYSKTIKDRSQYPRKAYLGDTGFMYAISGKKDLGKLYENAVFLELKRRLANNIEINYWKNKQGSEVDFVIREGLKVNEIIQVCYDITEEKTKSRELKGLVSCSKELRVNKGLIITKDFEDERTVEGIKIKFIPLWKWLLENRI